MNPNFKAVLLTILTLSVFTLVIIELTGISSNSLNALWHKKSAENNNKTGQPGNVINTVIDSRSQQVNAMPKTTMKFDETNFDFGTIPDSKEVKHVFKFRNTGKNPLMIAKADVSCGCTVPSFSKEPIAPGAEGEITVTFNPKGKSGKQHKNVIIHSNGELEAVSIGFDAEVK